MTTSRLHCSTHRKKKETLRLYVFFLSPAVVPVYHSLPTRTVTVVGTYLIAHAQSSEMKEDVERTQVVTFTNL